MSDLALLNDDFSSVFSIFPVNIEEMLPRFRKSHTVAIRVFVCTTVFQIRLWQCSASRSSEECQGKKETEISWTFINCKTERRLFNR